MNKSVWVMLLLFVIPIVMWFTPPPEGLSVEAWRVLGIYIAAIIGLVLKPYPEPIILLAAVGATAFLCDAKGALSGYASTTTWLVFSAFTLSTAFVVTGLGRRIAYHLIGKLGGTTLGLGYVTAFLDLIVSPATPSNTARAGGIVFPIMNNVAVALGSEPGETAKKVGSFLMLNTYMVTKITSFMFLTAMAPNGLAADYAAKILGVTIDWGFWFKGLFAPGVLLLLIIPFVVYIMTKPELKRVEHKKISEEGLKELGPMSKQEKMLIVLFVLALLGWMMPAVMDLLGVKVNIDAAAVAVVIMAAIFLTNVLKWDDMLKSKGGWNTLIWFGGIIGLSSVLTKVGFFEWLATTMQNHMHFGHSPILALWIVVFASIIVRYLFASGSAYIAAMLPVFLTVGLSAGAPPVALALALCASNAYGGTLTHYTGAAAPIIFGAGYNTTKSWWTVGAVLAVVCYLFMMTVGMAWWKILGLY